MRAFFLSVAIFIAFAGTISAQNLAPDYNWEVGINGGISAFTRPLGPDALYQGTRTNVVSDFSVRLNYFFNEHWMLCGDIGNRQWQSTGTWQEFGTMGQKLPSQNITFLIADRALTESAEMNYVIPFYTKFHTYNKANLYFGAMLGIITTINDGSLGYSKYKSGVDSGATYLSSYHYGYGLGYSYGIQMGYTYYIVPRLAVNVEIAARYADVKTNDDKYNQENSRYNLLYFPETIGIRYRF